MSQSIEKLGEEMKEALVAEIAKIAPNVPICAPKIYGTDGEGKCRSKQYSSDCDQDLLREHLIAEARNMGREIGAEIVRKSKDGSSLPGHRLVYIECWPITLTTIKGSDRIVEFRHAGRAAWVADEDLKGYTILETK